MRLWPLISGVALIGFQAQLLAAQDVPANTPSTALTVYARTVVEDVVVMDKSGRAVQGLHKDDFQIFENSKPQSISFFEPNFATKETASALPAGLPPNTFSNVPVAPPNDVTNVLLLDALNTRSPERMYAQVQMVKYLASLPPNMRIAIFTLDNEKFHLIWGFNQDSSALRAAIAQITAKRSHSASPSSDAQQRDEQQQLIASIGAVKQQANQARDDRLGESADALQHFLSHGPGIIYEYGNFFTTMSALEALAHYLAGIPGRKNLFWVAGTFPHQFKNGAYFDWYQRAREKLAEAEVSVYPIDANGVDVDTGGFQSGLAISASSARFENAEGWAEETGGKAYHENNINQEIADAADHGSLYYRLAYVPSDNKEEGRERKIEVKIPSGDYKLFYRQRYFELTRKEIAKSEAAPAKDPFLGLMGRGMPNVSEIPFHLRVVPAAAQPGAGTPRAGQNPELSGKLTRYSIGFRLLPKSLLLMPDGDGSRRKSLQVLLLVFSQDGKPLNWESNTITLLVKPEQWAADQKTGIAFHLQIDAPPGDVYLRTGIYDSKSSKVGTLEIPLSAVTPAKH